MKVWGFIFAAFFAPTIATADQCIRAHFPFNKAVTSTESVLQIQEFARSHLGSRFVVMGHADAWAKEDYNFRLGASRADYVAGILRKTGIADRNIALQSRGELNLVAPNPGKHDLDQIRNRRVEVCALSD